MRKIKIIDKEKLTKDYEEGIKNNEFKIYLQPKYDTQTEQIVGAEALIRRKKEGKIIMPSEFIEKYEYTGIITKLDNFVFEEVCKKIKEWKQKYNQELQISINESRRHLYNENHVSEITSIIKKYNINPKNIELELTESVVVHNIQAAKEAERKVHQAGFIVSMDDFGVGYSSFSMLKQINIDILKIDKIFLQDLTEENQNKNKNKKETNENNIKRARIIFESIIEMSKKLKIKTVAEGVETRQQVDYLKQIGCDYIQGYYFSKPMPIKEFENLILKTDNYNTHQ